MQVITGDGDDIVLINVIYSDGGRGEAGFEPSGNDCVIRAISHVMDRNYRKWHTLAHTTNKTHGLIPTTGDAMTLTSIDKILSDADFECHNFSYMGIPNKSVEHFNYYTKSFHEVFTQYKKYPRCLLSCVKLEIEKEHIRGHATAIVDGEVLDTWDPTDWRVCRIYYKGEPCS